MLENKKGSAMVATIFVAVVIGLWTAAILQSTFTEYKMSKRYLDMQSAMNLAESGLEEGVRAYNSGDWTGWTSYSNGYYKSTAPSTLSSGLTGSIKIFVGDDATSPSIAAEGSVTGVDGQPIIKQVRVDMSSSSLFANGLLARRNVVMNGNNVVVDSYDSSVPGGYTPSPSTTNRKSNGNVASLSLTNTDVAINNADIWGYLSVGGSFDVNASFNNNGTLGEIGVTSTGTKDLSRVTEDFYANIPDAAEPSYGGWTDISTVNGGSSAVNGPLTIGNPVAVTPTEYQLDSIGLSGNGDTLVIDGPVRLYVRNGVSVSGKGGIRITNNGSLELYTNDSISISGNGSAYGMQNETEKPEKFMIYNTITTPGGNTVTVSGNGLVYSVIYAPNSNVHLSGGGSSGSVYGAIVGYDITLNGGYEFHYDEALASLGGSGGLSIDMWRELRDVGERLPFDTPTQLNTYF